MIANKYSIQEKIGNGSFGNVFKGINKRTLKPVAIKMEDKNTQFPLLKHETTILKYLAENKCVNIPTIYWYGSDEFKRYTILVMSYYDCNLYEFMCQVEDVDSILPGCMIQCIQLIQSIHQHYIVHRDIKPQNFMLQNKRLILIDFGLSLFYIDESKNHIENKQCVGGAESNEINRIGSIRYSSYFLYEGNTYSRRDDLLSIGYLYLFFYNNKTLYWDTCTDSECKYYKSWKFLSTKILDNSIRNYLQYCYSLEFADTPIYRGLLQYFTKST